MGNWLPVELNDFINLTSIYPEVSKDPKFRKSVAQCFEYFLSDSMV